MNGKLVEKVENGIDCLLFREPMQWEYNLKCEKSTVPKSLLHNDVAGAFNEDWGICNNMAIPLGNEGVKAGPKAHHVELDSVQYVHLGTGSTWVGTTPSMGLYAVKELEYKERENLQCYNGTVETITVHNDEEVISFVRGNGVPKGKATSSKGVKGAMRLINNMQINPKEMEGRLPMWRGESNKLVRRRKYKKT